MRAEGGLLLWKTFQVALGKLLTIQWKVTARQGRHDLTGGVTADAWGGDGLCGESFVVMWRCWRIVERLEVGEKRGGVPQVGLVEGFLER